MNRKFWKSVLQIVSILLFAFPLVSQSAAGNLRIAAGNLPVIGLLTATGAKGTVPLATADIVSTGGTAVTGYAGQGLATIQRPASVRVGDTMFVNVSTGGPNDSYTAPDGWTLVSDGSRTAENSAFITARLYSKVLTATDTASYVWRVGASQGYAVSLLAFSGIGRVDAIGSNSVQMAKSTAPISLNALADSALLYFWVNNDQGSTATPPAGMTMPAAVATGGIGLSSASGFAAYRIDVPAGIYSLQGSLSGSTRTAAIAVAVSPAVIVAPVSPGSLSLSAASYNVQQSSGFAQISVSRSGGSDGAVSIAYSTADGSASDDLDYDASSGVLNWADGDSAARTISIPLGSNGFVGRRSFSINLANAAGGATVGSIDSATVTITGSALASRGVLAFSSASYSVSQDGGSLNVTVSRTDGATGLISVAYNTADGSARGGTDYTATSGTLIWLGLANSSRSFSIPIRNTSAYTGSRQFTVSLSSGTGSVAIGTPSTATITINGSGVLSPGSIALNSANYAVAQSSGALPVTVNRTGGSSGTVSVAYATSNGDASAGIDYTRTAGTLTWADGDTAAKTFIVPISTATPFTGGKIFSIDLSNLTGGATFGPPSSGTVTINGSGALPSGTLALSTPSQGVEQNAGSVTVNVTRSAGSAGDVLAIYTTVNGSASAGGDYSLTLGTLNWAAGDTTPKSVTIAISNSTPFTGSKTFSLSLLSVGGGALLGVPTTAIITINGSGIVPPIGTAIGATGAARLLTQATFGATSSTVASAANQSYDQWFAGQVLAVPSLILPNVSNSQTAWTPFWWRNVILGPDQLRQRMAWALAQIMVVTSQAGPLNANNTAVAAYYDLLTTNAFGNFRTLLERITLSPQMGLMLSMFRNNKEDVASGLHADQNYAREIMQLFTVGLVQLNLDGTPRRDGNGNTIPTYGYSEIENLSNVFTGWSSYSPDGDNEQGWLYMLDFLNPMLPYSAHHDTRAKTIIGGAYVPPGGTASNDLRIALDTLYNHPNVGPFIGKQLILRLVTSNPTPAYVARVATVFNNNGLGVRGDLLAVLRAILTDPEAVNTPTSPGYGKLREPLLKLTQLWRAFNATDGNNGLNEYTIVQNAGDITGQQPLNAATVFNFFQPDYVRAGALAAAGLVAPEFQILNENTLVLTANQMQTQAYQFVDGSGAGHQGFQGYDEHTGSVVLRTSGWESLADDPAALVDQFNRIFLLGQMPAAMRASLITYANAIPVTDSSYRGRRVVELADLIINSPQYAIQR